MIRGGHIRDLCFSKFAIIVKVICLLVVIATSYLILDENLFWLGSDDTDRTFNINNHTNSELIKMMSLSETDISIEGLDLKNVKIGVIDSGIKTKQNSLDVIPVNNHKSKNGQHGTAVASIIGGNSNDELKYTGMLPGVKLYSYNISASNLTADTLAEAINEMANLNLDVINISMGINKDIQSLEKSVKRAIKKGAIIVSATGNNGNDELNFPASYNLEGNISVGAINKDFRVWNYSNVNEEVDFYAPGTNIRVLNFSKEKTIIKEVSGTSFSAPLITSWIALVKAKYPNLTTKEIDDLLKNSSVVREARWQNEIIKIRIPDIAASLSSS